MGKLWFNVLCEGMVPCVLRQGGNFSFDCKFTFYVQNTKYRILFEEIIKLSPSDYMNEKICSNSEINNSKGELLPSHKGWYSNRLR